MIKICGQRPQGRTKVSGFWTSCILGTAGGTSHESVGIFRPGYVSFDVAVPFGGELICL